MQIQNKNIVITGTGSGIGKALAIECAKAGANVIINDYKSDLLQETVTYLKALGGNHRVMAKAFDVSDRAAFENFAKEAIEEMGTIDGVINNAGVALGRFSVEETPYEDFEWLLGINLWGMIYGTKSFLPHLISRPEAFVVNISSIFGIMGVGFQSAYCTSKFAIRGFTESLRMEMQGLHPHVKVISVHPGGIDTNIARNSRWAEDANEAERQQSIQDFEKLLAKTSSEQAAKVIIKGIQKKQERILIGNDAKLADRVVRWLPESYTKVVMRQFKKNFDTDKWEK